MAPSLLVEVANSGGAHTPKPLHEVGAAHGEKRDAGLRSDGPGKEGLPRARGAIKQGTLIRRGRGG